MRLRLALVILVAAGSGQGFAAADEPAPGPLADRAYPLDNVPREVIGKKVVCPDVETEIYRGTTIRYDHPARIYVPFEERLRGLEELIRDTAIEVYGRAPVLLRHDGTYNCRVIRTYHMLL